MVGSNSYTRFVFLNPVRNQIMDVTQMLYACISVLVNNKLNFALFIGW